jgi:uncharacterized protein (TIGR02246 family)
MKRYGRVSMLFLVTLIVGADASDAVAQKAIRQVLDDQAAAWNKGDLDGFMKGYWKSDRLTFFSGNTKTAGWQATLERYQKRYQGKGNEMGQLTFSELEIEMLGPGAALVKGRFTLTTRTGKPTGLFSVTFKKMPEGWRIVHDHTSS